MWVQRMHLCCELNPDGSTLTVLDTQGSNDSISIIFEAAHDKALVHAIHYTQSYAYGE
jgi:hypothetical protein